MIRRRHGNAFVCCDLCPGRPVLPTPNDEVNPAKCIRCQGDYRWLPVPHPEDHLCDVCRRECPDCQAPSATGGRCLTCQGRCRTCQGSLPERDFTVHAVEPEARKDRKRRWRRHFYPHTAGRDRCDRCLEQAGSRDPLRAVLAAVPDRLLRACGGAYPPEAMRTIWAQLDHRTARQLVERVERRWWTSWSNRPLRRDADERRDGYGPDDVVLWLLAPAGCYAACEDGFDPDDPDLPCPACRGHAALPGPSATRGEPAEDPSRTADRTPAEAVAHRPPMTECTGRDGACGVPVTAPYRQCPACLDWPLCACGYRRYDPARATACPACSSAPDRG
ncbi:hypothetical protein ACQEVS_26700 [Streptomyces sp. CA-181903]|uniref:hypothetical protein n=1 Tax=Streptomyces sp. CA-181903 TaxID=3240055 RepID=UPI003D907335